ncbi:MAG: hypothetical protein ABWY14_13310 [Tardiphaga sp.]
MPKGSLPDWIGLIIATIGAVSAISQYLLNSKRQRAIKAADEIEALTNDESAKAILRLIDWESAHISVRNEAGELVSHFVDQQQFLLAIRHHSLRRDQVTDYRAENDAHASHMHGFSIDEERLRDMMDRFLNRLERIESLIENKVIVAADFQSYFSYWLNLLDETSDDQNRTLSPAKKSAIWSYIRNYEFGGVITLFGRYGKTKERNWFRPSPGPSSYSDHTAVKASAIDSASNADRTIETGTPADLGRT